MAGEYFTVYATHDETGRLWKGPRYLIPERYKEFAIATCGRDHPQPYCVCVECRILREPDFAKVWLQTTQKSDSAV